MIDGEQLQHLNETPGTARCSICKSTTLEINDIDALLERAPSVDYTSMSALHERIKFMEYTLELSLYLENGTNSCDIDGKGRSRNRRMKLVKERFRKRLGIEVDTVKQQMGTTNDRNTTIRF